MSYFLPKFTPFQDAERVQIRFPPDDVFVSTESDGLWTVRYDGSENVWGLEDTEAGTFLGGEQDWKVRWSANSEYVFLYRVVEVEEDPEAPPEGEEPPSYFWITTRHIYLGRASTPGEVEHVDLTEKATEPNLDKFGWKFRNESLTTDTTVTARLESQGDVNPSTFTHVHAHTVHVPQLNVDSWDNKDALHVSDLRAETADVAELNVQTLGTIRYPVTFRDRARVLVQHPTRSQNAFLTLSGPDQWGYTNEEHAWTLSNPVDPNGWTITSTTSGASQVNVQFRRLQTQPGFLLIRPVNNRLLFLRHTDLVWEDATDVQSDPTFEEARTDLHWDVTLASVPAPEDRYVREITGSMIDASKNSDGTQEIQHKTLFQRGINPVQAEDLISDIQTDEFGHITGLTVYEDNNDEGSGLARRATVFQFEQRGWDAVGTANDLELYQDWIGVTEDQFKRSWWTQSVVKVTSPNRLVQTPDGFLETGYVLQPPAWATTAEIFLVGGGGAGESGGLTGQGGDSGGGGGGYTHRETIELQGSSMHRISVGRGGATRGENGRVSSFDTFIANGGFGANGNNGGDGGSGGGAGNQGNNCSLAGGDGGSDGADGGMTFGSDAGVPGTGQGTTTRAFHDPSGTLYAGGGGGGNCEDENFGSGGQGGGGNGAPDGGNQAQSGTPHTGGGGGGSRSVTRDLFGAGGSGIVLVKLKSANGTITQDLAFHYGDHDGTYQDADATVAAKNGRFFADMPRSVEIQGVNNDVTRISTSAIDDSLQGKFVGAVTTPDGNVFLIPHQAPSALLFLPSRYSTQEIDMGTEPGDFAGGVMTETGKIACIPFNKDEMWFVRAPTWTLENPERDQISLPSELSTGTQRFFGGARMTEGEIVCAPYNASQVAIYDTRVDDWSLYPLPSSVLNQANSERYRGAVACPDGQVVCIPHRAQTFLHVVENTTLVQRLPEPEPGDGLYLPDDEPYSTYAPGAFGAVATQKQRKEDLTLVMDVRIPTFEEITNDMCLFNAGGPDRATWIGIRRLDDSSVEFYARAGDARRPPRESTAILRIPNPVFFDGNVHRLLVDIRTDPGQIRIFVDDLLQGQRNINVMLWAGRPDSPQWAGGNPFNMYGGTFSGQNLASTPFGEDGIEMSNANWYGFPHSILSPVRLYTGLRAPEDYLIPRAARLKWARTWLQPVDTPELSGYTTIAPVNDTEVGTDRWQRQHEWGELIDAETFEFYNVSMEPSLTSFPRVPRLVNNDDGADTDNIQWQNWTFTNAAEWTCEATTEADGNFEAYRVFQDGPTFWRSQTMIEPQVLTLHTPRALRPRGYTMRANFNSNAFQNQDVPVEWKLYGRNGNTRTELHHALPGDYPFNNSTDPETRTVTILDLNSSSVNAYSSFELEILDVNSSASPRRVALERWDILFYPDETDGFPAWNTMNKVTEDTSKSWRIFGTNVEGVSIDMTYHQPRRLHAVEITSGERLATTNHLGLKGIEIQAKNKDDLVWQLITQQPNADGTSPWTSGRQTVRWVLEEPSEAYEMFRLIVTESDVSTYVCIQEWNLQTSQALPVDDMFANEEPFLLESGDTHDQTSPAYWGGAFTSRGIVCAPFEATNIGIYDITTRRLLQGREVGAGKYADARTLSNGMVALIPYDESAKLLIYDPTIDEIVSEHVIDNAGPNAFAGGALTFDGQLVLAPYDAPDVRALDVGILPHPALVTHPSVN